jgi:dinuclear metal center YbgI/SA1388 family protein
MASLRAIVDYLDVELRTREVPDYPGALNGLQLDNNGSVSRIAAAVDASTLTLRKVVDLQADLLLVHHGLFWGGATPLVGPMYEKVQLALEHNVAIYSAHIPLDLHPAWGNNVLLAKELGLKPAGGFASLRGVPVGVSGESDVETRELFERAAGFSARHGGSAVSTPLRDGQRTRRWGMCTGAGASSDTLREAAEMLLDTLIVGEGPHHTAVAAMDSGLTIMYLGHYATETLGVAALAQELGRRFSLDASFVEAPTGL